MLGRLNNQENSMGSMTDKIKGATNEAAGKAKQGAGEAVGSDRMKGEGAVRSQIRTGRYGPPSCRTSCLSYRPHKATPCSASRRYQRAWAMRRFRSWRR